LGAPSSFRISDPSSFGTAIREFRVACGLSQAEVSAAVGIHRSYLSALERGHITEQVIRMLQIFRRLGVDVVLTMEGPDARG